jgi:deoxyuridine 5'-triphosphate nucleotidohydrolase
MNIKRFRKDAPLPERKTEGAVGYDLVACAYWDMMGRLWRADDMMSQIVPDDRGRVLIPCGFGFEVPPGRVGWVTGRGSTSEWVVAAPVDPDYRGEVWIKTTVHHLQAHKVRFNKFDRIAQLLLLHCDTPKLVEVEEFTTFTARGAGGHGSTGR